MNGFDKTYLRSEYHRAKNEGIIAVPGSKRQLLKGRYVHIIPEGTVPRTSNKNQDLLIQENYNFQNTSLFCFRHCSLL